MSSLEEPFEKNLDETIPTEAPGEASSSGPSAHHDTPSNENLDAGFVPDTSNMPLDLDVATITRQLLEQDTEFKRQVSELHRVVKLQNELLRELEMSQGSSSLPSQLLSETDDMMMSTAAMLNIPGGVIGSDLSVYACVDTDHDEKTETDHELPVDVDKTSALQSENIHPRQLLIDLNKVPEDVNIEEAEYPNVSDVMDIQQHGALTTPRLDMSGDPKGKEIRIEKMKQKCGLFDSGVAMSSLEEPFEKILSETIPTGAPGEALSSGPSAHHDRPSNENLDASLVPDTSNVSLDMDVATIRGKLIEQDTEFKKQVSELHRVVKLQNEIMRELRMSQGSSSSASRLLSDTDEIKPTIDAKGSGISLQEGESSQLKTLNIPGGVIGSELPADALVDTDHNEKIEIDHELPVDVNMTSALQSEIIRPRRLMIDLNRMPEDDDIEEAENPKISNVLDIQQHGARTTPRLDMFGNPKGKETRIEKLKQACGLFNSRVGRAKARIIDEFLPPPSLPSMMSNETFAPNNNQFYRSGHPLGISAFPATASLPCHTGFSPVNTETENSERSLRFPNGIWRNSIYATHTNDKLQTYKGSSGNACLPGGISPFINSDYERCSMVYPPMISTGGKVAPSFEPKREKLHVKGVGFPSMKPKTKSALISGPVLFAKQNFDQPKFGASHFSTGLSVCIQEHGRKRKMHEEFEGSSSGKDFEIYQGEMGLNSRPLDVPPVHRLPIVPPLSPDQLDDDEFWDSYFKPSRDAAVNLVTLVDETHIHSKNLNCKLAWFADTVLSAEDADDSFEAMTLKLEEVKEEEYSKWSGPISGENSSEKNANAANSLLGMARRGQGKKRRQKRDFQKDVLPALASLSRNEVIEDLQELEASMRKAGMPWSIKGGMSRRGKPRRNLGVDLEDETDGLIPPETPTNMTNVVPGIATPVRRPRSARKNQPEKLRPAVRNIFW